MRRLTARGVGIIYISHRMEEIAQVGNRVTVFRDGRHVGTVDAASASVPSLIKMMAGRELTEHFPRRRTPPGAELLRVEDLTRGKRLRGVSLTLRAGEVVGIAGLLGAGRTELARAIVGADRPDSGRVVIRGEDVARARSRGRDPPRRRLPARGPQDAGARARPRRALQPRPALRAPALADGRAGRRRAGRLRPALGGRPAHQDPEPGPAGRPALGRQPAEGRAREVAGHRRADPHPRRAHARHRRGRADGDLRADEPAHRVRAWAS